MMGSGCVWRFYGSEMMKSIAQYAIEARAKVS